MAATTNSLGLTPGAVGLAANGTTYAGSLGQTYVISGNTWRVVKAAGALTTMGRALVVSAMSGGLPTFVATTSTTANDFNWVGICHSSQGDLAAGDYFLVQCGGYAEIISAAAIAANVAVGCSTTAKKGDDATISLGGIVGYSTESAAGVDENVGIVMVTK